MQNNPFGNLTQARAVDTYVSPPIGRMYDVLEHKETQYINNQNKAIGLEVALNNIKVSPKDQYIKDSAINDLQSNISAIAERGDWENADLIVKQSAKDIAINSGLNAATTSYTKKLADLQALKGRVGLSEDEGGITEDDYLYEANKAESLDTGVKYDATTNTWESTFKLNDPPANINMGDRTDKFLTDYKPDTLLGSGLVKKADGKWYKVAEYPTTPDDMTWLDRSTEVAEYSEVYQAAKDHLMQDPQANSRLKYDLGKMSTMDYKYYEAIGINREAMIKNLVNVLGYKRTELEALSDDQLTDKYKEDVMVHSKIVGAVNKHSYIKEDVSKLSDTLLASMYKERVKAAGSEDALQTYAIIDTAVTQPYKLDIPKDTSMHSFLNNSINEQLERVNKEANLLYEKIQKEPSYEKYNKGEITEKQFIDKLKDTVTYANYMKQRAVIKGLENQKKVNDRIYQSSADEVKKELGIEVDENIEKEFYALKSSPNLQVVLSSKAYMGKPIKSIKVGDEIYDYDLKKKVPVTQEMFNDYEKYKVLYDKVGSIITGTDFSKKVNDKMKAYYNETVVDYPYTYMADNGFGETSDWSKYMTKDFKNNISSWYLIDQDGTRIDFNVNGINEKINVNNAEVIGKVNQPVYGHDYAYVVSEKRTKLVDGKEVPTGEPPRISLVIPTVGIEQKNKMSINAVNRGYGVVKGRVKDDYIMNDPSDIAKVWQFTGIDNQLAAFNALDASPNPNGVNSLELDVAIGVNYDMKVRREVGPSGLTTYVVRGTDAKGEPIKTTKIGADGKPIAGFIPAEEARYDNIYQVQAALESLGGSSMQVPLKLLDPVNNSTFKNIRVTRDYEVPYLHTEFIKELDKLDGLLPLSIEFIGMSRTPLYNKKVGGVSNSKHLLGLGADFSIDSVGYEWLKEHYNLEDEVAKPIDGTDLKFLVHGEGANKHLHVEKISTPMAISNFTKAYN